MHKQVHERASEEWEPDKDAEHMGAVLGKQERAGNDKESDQDHPCP
jgi:hypothetical protein